MFDCPSSINESQYIIKPHASLYTHCTFTTSPFLSSSRWAEACGVCVRFTLSLFILPVQINEWIWSENSMPEDFHLNNTIYVLPFLWQNALWLSVLMEWNRGNFAHCKCTSTISPPISSFLSLSPNPFSLPLYFPLKLPILCEIEGFGLDIFLESRRSLGGGVCDGDV